MKVVILAGGFGTRLAEETDLKPKPMIEIGGLPIIWHIMKGYSNYGFNEFIVCLGYKAYLIKEYFSNYFLHRADVTIDLEHNSVEIHQHKAEPWKVTLIDTGPNTMTGGRIKRVSKHIGDEPFMLTYGDGVANVDINKLLAFHKEQGKLATLTAIQTAGRFGSLDLDGDSVKAFQEKPWGDGAWINGGFLVLEPEVLSYLENDSTIFERDPLTKLANSGQLSAYKHSGYWQCMDTIRDKQELEKQWASGHAGWKVWED